MEHNYYLCLKGRNFQGNPYVVSLGPFHEKTDAEKYSDSLTDSRIGEQLLTKFGVEQVIVVDNG